MSFYIRCIIGWKKRSQPNIIVIILQPQIFQNNISFTSQSHVRWFVKISEDIIETIYAVQLLVPLHVAKPKKPEL